MCDFETISTQRACETVRNTKPEDARNYDYLFDKDNKAHREYEVEKANRAYEADYYNNLPSMLSLYGDVTVEKMFQLDLRQLDALAITLHKQIADKGEVTSFISDTTEVDEQLNIKFKIVKDIIDERLALQKKREEEADIKARKDFLRDLIAGKEKDAYANKSVEELRAEYEALNK